MSQWNEYEVPSSCTDEQLTALGVFTAESLPTPLVQQCQRSVSDQTSSFDNFGQEQLKYILPLSNIAAPLSTSVEDNPYSVRPLFGSCRRC